MMWLLECERELNCLIFSFSVDALNTMKWRKGAVFRMAFRALLTMLSVGLRELRA